MRELTQSCHDVSEYPPTSIKVMTSECPILHVVIADQDSKCQDSTRVRDEHIHAIHEQCDGKDVQVERRTGYFEVHTHCER